MSRIKSRFKVGQKVYMGRFENLRSLTVKEVIDNPLLSMYQYAFEEVSFVCGEYSIRAKIDGRDLKIGECLKNEAPSIELTVNTVANGFDKLFDVDQNFGGIFFKPPFKPDILFVHWLIAYAGDRMIVDVGCGQGHLVRMVKKFGGKAMGLEPNFDYTAYIKLRAMKGNLETSINEILPYSIQDASELIKGMGNKAMLIFAKPCYGNFVETGLNIMSDDMEALYITIPENRKNIQNALGKYTSKAVLLEHLGVSEENEIVFSIKKQ
jgi:hypothetical protein